MSLAILLTFSAGQVQYGHTSYFCTMLNTFLPSPAVASAMHSRLAGNDVCSECQGARGNEAGVQVVEPNCFQIVSVHKDIVGSFLGSANTNFQDGGTFLFMMPQPLASRMSIQSRSVAQICFSPPLDLPIFNNNLRI